MTQGRVSLRTHTQSFNTRQTQLHAWDYYYYIPIKTSVLAKLLQIYQEKRATVDDAVSHGANFLGPIWIYHVVSPAIGAMHTPGSYRLHASHTAPDIDCDSHVFYDIQNIPQRGLDESAAKTNVTVVDSMNGNIR